MNTFTPDTFGAVLIGIFLFSLYFQSKFKGFIGMSFLCFLIVVLQISLPKNIGLQLLILAIPIIVVTIYGIREALKFEEQGRGIEIFQPTKKNIVFGLILLSIYILSKIFYFDR